MPEIRKLSIDGSGLCQMPKYSEAFPPAAANTPPRYTSLPLTAIVRTVSSTPLPNADQLLPFHLAIRFTAAGPAFVKAPPTYTLLPLTRIALTVESTPLPSADQLLPFHLAIRLALTPPAVVNAPPTYRLVPLTEIA